MKTLVLYATKYGAAKEIARRIAEKFDDAVVHDLNQADIPSLDEFDCVIIGGSLYAGAIQREVKEYTEQNKDVLCQKTAGLFLCGMAGNEADKYFEANFPQEVLEAAVATAFLGGIFDPAKASFAERVIMKIVAKKSAYTDTINEERIAAFAEELKK